MDFNVVTQVSVENGSAVSASEADSDSSASSVSPSDWLQLEMLLNVSPRERSQQFQAGPVNSQPITKTTTKTTKSLTTTTKTTTTVPALATDSSQKQSSSEQLDISEYVRLLQRLRRRRRLLGLGRDGQQQLQRLELAQRRLRQMLAAREDKAGDEGEGWEIQEESAGADEGDLSTSVTLLDCSLWNASSVAAAPDVRTHTADQTISMPTVNVPVEREQLQQPDSLEQQSDLQEQQSDLQEQQSDLQEQQSDPPSDPEAKKPAEDEPVIREPDEVSILDVRPSEEALSASSNLESVKRPPELTLQMPEVLDASAAKAQQRRRSQLQQLHQQQMSQAPPPKAARPLPHLPEPQPPGPKALLALTPLTACLVPEPIVFMTFDSVGRRLICSELSRGICFRSVTFSGDDLSACRRLDWRIWAHCASVLPSGHLLVATSCNLQVIRSDGLRLTSSERRFPILAMAVYERIVYIATCDSGKDQKNSYFIQVYELPHLKVKECHPLTQYSLRSPVEMCTLRNLAVVVQLDDDLQVIDIDSGRHRQSLRMSGRKGPRHLAACNKLGALFMSVMAERCIHIYQLRKGVLEKVGNFRDPTMLPGPLAWLPGNGILFCACSTADDPRRNEIRTLGLHEADRTNWTPRSIRLMPL